MTKTRPNFQKPQIEDQNPINPKGAKRNLKKAKMASSSVSQDDIDNDFEKNNRRSRIRTARARQINPSGTVNQNEKITFKNINKLRTFQNFSKLVQNCLKLLKLFRFVLNHSNLYVIIQIYLKFFKIQTCPTILKLFKLF